MSEITRPLLSNIEELAQKISNEGILKGFNQDDLLRESENPNAILLHYRECAFCLFHFTNEEADLIEIWCAPEFRNQGIARKLLNAGIEALKRENTKKCFLEVAIDNPVAIHLYESAGFHEIARRKQYYKRENQEYIDAISMLLEPD